MTGLPLIFVFILAIVLMIILISKLHIHPFVSIMCISLLLGVIAGIPLVKGKVISSSDMVNYISSHATALSAMGIFFPFLLSAVLKSAQGSSTVALTTTAGIAAPLLPVLGLDSPVRAALCCMAVGAGAMTVSHANDSFFWVVTNFGAMTPERGYKTWTLNTLVLGVAAVVEIFILSLFLH